MKKWRRTGGAADSDAILVRVQNDTTRYIKVSKATRTTPECITALDYKLLSRFREENPAAELMGRPLLRSTGNVTKVESAINNDRRHTVRDLAEISG